MHRKMRSHLAFAAALVPAMLMAPVAPALAAPVVTLEELGLSPDHARQLRDQLYAPTSSPGIAFGSPVGYGAHNELYAGIGGQTLPDTAQDSVDGSIALGVGLGDPVDWIGVDLSATVISITNDFGHDGNFNAKLHRALPYRMSVAIGIENTGRWGDAKATEDSKYAVITKFFGVGSDVAALSLNAGLGDNRFAKPGESGVGVFGGAALTFVGRVSVIGDWTGRDLNAAVSAAPYPKWPVVVTAGFVNLTEKYADMEFAGAVGFSYRF